MRLLHVSTPDVYISIISALVRTEIVLMSFSKARKQVPEDDTFGAETCRSLIIFMYLL
jgi:hypothetical protein